MDVKSSKKQIKDAVLQMYDIQTKKINTLIRCVKIEGLCEDWRNVLSCIFLLLKPLCCSSDLMASRRHTFA